MENCKVSDLVYGPHIIVEEEPMAGPSRSTPTKKTRYGPQKTGFKLLERPRPGKKLLVLDMDRTIYDPNTPSHQVRVLGSRPHLMKLLELAYQTFDICIWSAVPMYKILKKIDLMGIGNSTNSKFKISLLIEERAMTSFTTQQYCCCLRTDMVKSLESIWVRFFEYGPHNTLIVDDQKQNLLAQPNNGLRVTPYTYPLHSTDTELVKLAAYISFLGSSNKSIGSMSHANWRKHSSVKALKAQD